MQTALNSTATPFFIQILDLLWFASMFVCFRLAKIHNLLILYVYLCNLYRVNYWWRFQ